MVLPLLERQAQLILSLFVTLRANKNLDLILHPSGFTNVSCCHRLCLKLRIFHLKSRFPQDFKVTEEQSGVVELGKVT